MGASPVLLFTANLYRKFDIVPTYDAAMLVWSQDALLDHYCANWIPTPIKWIACSSPFNDL